MRISKLLSWLGGGLMVIVVIVSLFRLGQSLGSGVSVASSVVTNEGTAATLVDGVQQITLAFSNFNYTPNVIRVKRDIPVEITAGGTLQGCFSTFVAPELNVWEKFSGPGSKISFTPKRAGTYRFSCAMGMGNGKIIVEG